MIKNRVVLLFLTPAGALYLCFFLVPAAIALYYSLFDWSGFGKSMTFVGMANYARLLKDSVFWMSLSNTLLILGAGGMLVFGIAFLYTILITSGIWGKRLFRVIFFLPNVISMVAISSMWIYIYQPRSGLLASMLKAIGLPGLANTLWMAPDNIFWAMLAPIVWTFTGFFLILLIAGVEKVPADLYEAAGLEGASELQKFRLITLPLIWDIVLISFVVWIFTAMKTFEFPYAFGFPAVPQQIYTLGVYLYIMGFGAREPIYQLGYASTIGVVLLVITLVLILAMQRLLRRQAVEY